MVKEESPQITRRATRSVILAKGVVEEKDTSIQHPNNASANSDMVKEDRPKVTRATRPSALAKCSNNVVEQQNASSQQQLTSDDLVIGEGVESFRFDDLVSSFPGRESQIKELAYLLGPKNSVMLPIFIYGGSSTGKTSIVLQTFRHLKRPVVYTSCLTCYNPQIMFESILNQLFLHQKNPGNGYSSAKRCERLSDFVNFLRAALVSIIGNPQGQKSGILSSKRSGKATGDMIYLIFDNLERVKGWDKDDDLGQILMRNQANKKLYTCFLSVILRPFSRITRRVDE